MRQQLMDTSGLVTIRASGTTPWPDCQRRQAARAFRHIIEEAGFELNVTPQSIAAFMGSSTHAGGAHGIAWKLEHGDLPTLSEVEGVALADLDERLDGDYEVNWDTTAPHLDAAQKQVRRMLRVVHEQIAPTIDPIAVEDRMVCDLGDGFTLSGTLDYYAIEGRYEAKSDDFVHRVIDLKTGQPGVHAPQLGSYSLIRRSHGNQVDKLVIAHIPRVSLKQVQPDANWIDVDIEHAERAARTTIFDIKDRVQKFQETGDEHVFLANPLSKLCSRRWCPAFDTAFCREHMPDV